MANIDIRHLKIGGSYLVFGQAVQAFVAFAANLVLVRFIMPEGFGRFALVLAGASIVLSLISLRLNILI
ncbi:MAG: hypothetical protein HQ503_14755, partial [Rhodospirillales bacterium]|nr:hypothetical protein [Rhodospirillales bacterium]